MLTCRHWCWRGNGSRGGTIYQRLISVTREVLLGEARDSIPSWTDMWGLGHWESSLTPSSTCSASHGLPGAGSRGTRGSAHSPHVTETVLVDSCSETLLGAALLLSRGCIKNNHWRRAWQPTPVFLPGKPLGQKSLAGYSSWGHKDKDCSSRGWTWLATEQQAPF